MAVEFYHAQLDHYFITADAKEINDLDTGVHKGWTRTGYRFSVIKGGSSYAGTSPVCRFYSATLDTHFYSAKKSECDAVKEKFGSVWTFEADEVFRAFVVDPATGVCGADTTPTYRLYNNRPDANHRYTDQVGVFLFMKGKGHIPEGDGNPALPIVFCTPSGGDVVPIANESAPNCTVTAGSSTPAVGTTLNLNAACTNNPTSYMWVGCTSSGSSCTSTKPAAGSASYTLYAANASGPGDPVTLTVNWGGGGGGGGGGALPICTLSSSTLQATTGSPVTLTASCNNTPASYEWWICSATIGNPGDPTSPPLCNANPSCAATSPTCAVSQAQAGAARYAANAKNASGTGPKVYVDMVWTGAGGPPGGGGGGPVAPVCSISSSNASPSTGSTVTLTATCSGNPTSYDWIGSGLVGSCASSATCQASWNVAQSVTYGVSGIAGTLTGGRAYVGVNWTNSTPQPPACTLSASNTTPSVGQTITITSSCSNSPISYTWKAGCTSTASSCTDSSSVAGAKTYTMTATNAAGNSPDASVSVNWQPLPTQPPACTVTSSNPTPSVGQNITLTAACTNSPLSYAWTNCTSTGSTCSTTTTVEGNATYGVTATNGIGTSPLATVQVNWQKSSGGTNYCGPNTAYVDIPWGAAGPRFGRWVTTDYGGFPQGKIFVFSITVPVGTAHSTFAQTFAPAEYQGPPAPRSMTLSENLCDFSNYLEGASGTAPLIQFNVGSGPGNVLTPGKTYYFNLRNDNCGQSSCDMSVSIPWR